MLLEFMRVQWNWKMYWHFKEQDMKDNVFRTHDVMDCPCMTCCAWRRDKLRKNVTLAGDNGDVDAERAPISKEDLS
jgi:hypothetical protein